MCFPTDFYFENVAVFSWSFGLDATLGTKCAREAIHPRLALNVGNEEKYVFLYNFLDCICKCTLVDIWSALRQQVRSLEHGTFLCITPTFFSLAWKTFVFRRLKLYSVISSRPLNSVNCLTSRIEHALSTRGIRVGTGGPPSQHVSKNPPMLAKWV